MSLGAGGPVCSSDTAEEANAMATRQIPDGRDADFPLRATTSTEALRNGGHVIVLSSNADDDPGKPSKRRELPCAGQCLLPLPSRRSEERWRSGLPGLRAQA